MTKWLKDGRRPQTASGSVLEVVDALQHGKYLFNMLAQTQRTTWRVPKGMGAVARKRGNLADTNLTFCFLLLRLPLFVLARSC